MALRDPKTGRFVSSGTFGNGVVTGSVATRSDLAKVEKAAQKAMFRNLGHAAASISKSAKESIEQSSAPAPAGHPPHTRRKLLRKAIQFKVDPTRAVIGPRQSVAGVSGKAHEFGGRFRGDVYPERPFMAPALEKATPRFAGSFAGSIGE